MCLRSISPDDSHFPSLGLCCMAVNSCLVCPCTWQKGFHEKTDCDLLFWKSLIQNSFMNLSTAGICNKKCDSYSNRHSRILLPSSCITKVTNPEDRVTPFPTISLRHKILIGIKFASFATFFFFSTDATSTLLKIKPHCKEVGVWSPCKQLI